MSAALEQTTEAAVAEVGPVALKVKVTKDGQLHDAIVQVFREGETDFMASQRTYDHEDQNPTSFSVPPGNYRIKAVPLGTDAEDIWRDSVVVIENEVEEVEIDFTAGIISINTTMNADPWDCVVNITKAEKKKSVTGGRTYKDGSHEFELSPGFYDIEISAMQLKGSQTSHRFEGVEVLAGETTKVIHNFQNGELSILGTNNGAFWDCVINISTKVGQKDKSIAGGRTYHSTTNNAISKLLTPGTYSVHYNPHHIHGADAEITRHNVEVLAGKVTEVVHDFKTGTLYLGARHEGTPCKFDIYVRQEGSRVYSRRAIIDKETNLAKLIFTPGTYEVTITPVRVENTVPQKFSITIAHKDVVERVLDF